MNCQCAAKGFEVGAQVDWISAQGAYRYHGEITSMDADPNMFPLLPGRHCITVRWTRSNREGSIVVTTQGIRCRVVLPWLWAEACDERQLSLCGPVCRY
jgi:hypothetical protein